MPAAARTSVAGWPPEAEAAMPLWGPESSQQWGAAGHVVRANSASVMGYPQQPPPLGAVAPGTQQAPPGWFGAHGAHGAHPQMLAAMPARRFPGHFVPHRLCNHFSIHGWCRKAEACTFAHGMQELHPDVQAQMVPAPQPGLTMGHSVAGTTHVKVKGGGKGAVSASDDIRQMLGIPKHGEQAAPPQERAAGNPVLSTAPGRAPPPAAAVEDRFMMGPDCAAEAHAGGAPALNGAADDFTFNAGAVPFVPQPASNGVAESHGAGAKESRSNSSPSSPNLRRPVPSPLTDDADSPVRASAINGTVASIPPSSPSAVVIKTVVRRPSVASPVSAASQLTSSVRQQAMSPKATMMSPNSSMQATASAVAMTAISSPVSSTAHLQLQSPTAKGPMSLLLRSPVSRASVPWPGSPTVAMSPLAAPSTPVPIARSTLLQARTVVQRIEQGPPGLAHCAPTPTTKAKNLGFRYPEPGWLTARPMPGRSPAPARRK